MQLAYIIYIICYIFDFWYVMLGIYVYIDIIYYTKILNSTCIQIYQSFIINVPHAYTYTRTDSPMKHIYI